MVSTVDAFGPVEGIAVAMRIRSALDLVLRLTALKLKVKADPVSTPGSVALGH